LKSIADDISSNSYEQKVATRRILDPDETRSFQEIMKDSGNISPASKEGKELLALGRQLNNLDATPEQRKALMDQLDACKTDSCRKDLLKDVANGDLDGQSRNFQGDRPFGGEKGQAVDCPFGLANQKNEIVYQNHDSTQTKTYVADKTFRLIIFTPVDKDGKKDKRNMAPTSFFEPSDARKLYDPNDLKSKGNFLVDKGGVTPFNKSSDPKLKTVASAALKCCQQVVPGDSKKCLSSIGSTRFTGSIAGQPRAKVAP
jgi:hypothetical protein